MLLFNYLHLNTFAWVMKVVELGRRGGRSLCTDRVTLLLISWLLSSHLITLSFILISVFILLFVQKAAEGSDSGQRLWSPSSSQSRSHCLNDKYWEWAPVRRLDTCSAQTSNCHTVNWGIQTIHCNYYY